MKVGFAARFSPLDKRSWSGTNYYAYQQIKKYNEVEIFHYKWTWLLREWLTMQKSMNRRIFKKRTSVEFLKTYSKYFSKQLEQDLEKRKVDLLFVPASSQLIAFLETKIPIIYMTDATFYQLQGYYPNFTNLAEYNIKQGVALDKMAFEKASHLILGSEWNKISAINDYGIDPGKISVLPCGANLDLIPGHDDLNGTGSDQCRLLFLGVEWERKGGDIALESFRLLNKKGVNAHLHIVGCSPPQDLSHEKNISVIPFLDKNKTEDFQQLQEILLQTDFLLLPTRAECAGVVFSEASAYGIPSIATETGGVRTYVQDGVNGYALPFVANANDYAETISNLYYDKSGLKELKKTCREYYDSKLNWDLWGKRFQEIAEKIISS